MEVNLAAGLLFGKKQGDCTEKNTKKYSKNPEKSKKQIAILRITMYNSFAVA